MFRIVFDADETWSHRLTSVGLWLGLLCGLPALLFFLRPDFPRFLCLVEEGRRTLVVPGKFLDEAGLLNVEARC